MKKAFLNLALILSLNAVAAQDLLFDKPLILKGSKDKRDVYPVINQSTGAVVMFFFDKFTIQSVALDASYNIESEMESQRPPGMFDEILGSSISGDLYTIYFSSTNHKNFATTTFDFKTKKVIQRVINFNFKKNERYSCSITQKGTFYMVTAMDPDIVKIYALTDPKEFRSREKSFPYQKFSGEPGASLYDVLTKNEVVSFDNAVPTALEMAAKKTKLYPYDNNIVLTIDNYEFRTNIILIDGRTLESTLKFNNQPSIFCADEKRSNSNSYIYDRKLFQMKICPVEMAITIFDLDKEVFLNKLTIKRDDDDFSFNNSPVIQSSVVENKKWYDDNDSDVVISKTKKFLKKVSYWNAGLSAFGSPDGIQLTIGGYKEMEGGGSGGGMMFPGTTMSTPMGPIVTAPMYNPTFYSYSSYKSTLSIYFKSLLDPDSLQHKAGEIKDNAFDKIQKYTEGLEKKISVETIFRKDGVYVLGYYFKPDERYVLRKFAD
jgi:hypothetical protein